MPPPHRVVAALADQLVAGPLAREAKTTLEAALGGFAVAVLAVPLGVLLGVQRRLRDLTSVVIELLANAVGTADPAG